MNLSAYRMKSSSLRPPRDPRTRRGAPRWAWVLLMLQGLVVISDASAQVNQDKPSSPPRVSVVVGHMTAGEGGAGGDLKSPLQSPFGIDFDAQGNLYIVELAGGRVFRRDSKGILKRIAGDGSEGYRGDGGSAQDATFRGMHNLAVTPAGEIYISDSWNHCVRKIDRQGRITTVVGTGQAGYRDAKQGNQAQFDYLMCITWDAAFENLLIADLRNRRVRAWNARTGQVRTIAGNGTRGVPEDGVRAINAPLVDPRAVASDSQGRVYILERGGHALRRVEADGTLRTVAGSGRKGFADGVAHQAEFNSPKHLAVDAQDRVVIADDGNAAIRLYDPAEDRVVTLVGRGPTEPALRLNRPHGVCVEQDRLWIVDSENHRILRIDEPYDAWVRRVLGAALQK